MLTCKVYTDIFFLMGAIFSLNRQTVCFWLLIHDNIRGPLVTFKLFNCASCTCDVMASSSAS